MNSKIAFIKKIRTLFGYGLRDAKALADYIEDKIKVGDIILVVNNDYNDGDIRMSAHTEMKNLIITFFNKNNLCWCDEFLHHFFLDSEVNVGEGQQSDIDLYELLYYQVKEQDLSLEKFKEFIKINFNYAPFA